jgi:predicted DCC family thiol-disulfide oxidoreductase YuxK
MMITIIYDGDCPLCQDYVRRLRLVEVAGEVVLVNARSDHPSVIEAWQSGYDLDQGMLAMIGTNVFYGAEAVAALARLSTTNTLFNRFNHAVLSRPNLTGRLYPLLKAARRIALMLRGKGSLDNPLNSTGLRHR